LWVLIVWTRHENGYFVFYFYSYCIGI
jgi:hypothetical protein